jgi:hypothetical protein
LNSGPGRDCFGRWSLGKIGKPCSRDGRKSVSGHGRVRALTRRFWGRSVAGFEIWRGRAGIALLGLAVERVWKGSAEAFPDACIAGSASFASGLRHGLLVRDARMPASGGRLMEQTVRTIQEARTDLSDGGRGLPLPASGCSSVPASERRAACLATRQEDLGQGVSELRYRLSQALGRESP